jgi:hypothetical protein
MRVRIEPLVEEQREDELLVVPRINRPPQEHGGAPEVGFELLLGDAGHATAEEMGGVVKPHFLLTDPLQIGQEGRVLNHAMEGQLKLVGGGFGRGKLLGTGDGVLEDEVHALAGAFHHPAALEDLGKAAIPRCLPVEQGFHGDLRKQTARALDREGGRACAG